MTSQNKIDWPYDNFRKRWLYPSERKLVTGRLSLQQRGSTDEDDAQQPLDESRRGDKHKDNKSK